MQASYDNIKIAVDALRSKKMVILTDDTNRENEGDLVFAAEFASPELINFMTHYGRGLICLSLEGSRVDTLRLPLMSQRNQSKYRTAFTVSIEAKEGVTTGISAADRTRTILTAISPEKGPDDIVTPGHIFPIRAMDFGVLERPGHTEGSIDLMKIAGLHPAAVICEIMNEDGTMARMADLERVSEKHHIPIVSIQDIIHYRYLHETLVERAAEAKMPTSYGEFTAYAYESRVDHEEHLVLIKGTPNSTPIVRVHSECITGDTLKSIRCDCGGQLHQSLEEIAESDYGILIYIKNHEGRGIGLANKIRAYALQDRGFDTVEANTQLGFDADMRNYGIAAQILKDLEIDSVCLLTNNPAKIRELELYGINVIENRPVTVAPTPFSRSYLETKRRKLGHTLLIETCCKG